MRIFIGLDLPDAVREGAARAAGEMRACLGRGAFGLSLRWVDPSAYHLTLWFIGETDDARVAAVRTALTMPWRAPAFALKLGAAGAFPERGLPRILWLGVRDGGAACAAVYRELEGRMTALGFTPERREYTAHLTVARVKDAPRRHVAGLRRCLDAVAAVDGAGIVDRVTLFRSHAGPAGSRYEPLLHVPLR
jgi:2'-5' RNA ligase